MKLRFVPIIIFIGLCFIFPAIVYANPKFLDESEILKNWSISGSNTLRMENYENGGNPDTHTYLHRGTQFFDEFDLHFARVKSPEEKWSGQVLGLVNDSAYRSTVEGLVFEHVSVNVEKTDGLVPLRMTLGDHFGFFSYRTLQRSLKGGQIEFQPKIGGENQHHSIVLLTGNTDTDYTNFHPSDDQYTGFSWLMEDPVLGSVSVNQVHNQRLSTIALRSLNQDVVSVASEKEFTLGSQFITLESELAYFQGDTTTNPEQNQSSPGYYMQMSGKSASPLTYRFRFEQYGENYQPNGAQTTADRQSLEAHFGWKFPSGINLQTRYQSFVDSWQQHNYTQTNTYGFKLLGVAPGFASGGAAIDGFISDKANQDKTTNSQTRSINFNLPIPAGEWLLLSGTLLQALQDKAAGTTATTYQQTIGTSRPLTLGVFEGSMTPGIIYRMLNGASTDAQEYGLSFGLGLRHDRQGINFNYEFLQQNPREPANHNVLSNNLGLQYTYEVGSHLLSLEADYRERAPDNVAHNDGTRFSFSYTYSFDKMPLPNSFGTSIIQQSAAELLKEFIDDPVALDNLFPNSDLDQQAKRLKHDGFLGSTLQKGLLSYETPLLTSIDQRQRLVLVHNGKVIKESVLIIEFDDIGNADSAVQTFERVRQELLKLYGQPFRSFEKGVFTANYVSDIYTEKLIRVMEWQTKGGIIRFGIPRRLDRKVRMEILHSREILPLKKTNWSVEEVQ